jgi:CheY-like chemotaxis protein
MDTQPSKGADVERQCEEQPFRVLVIDDNEIDREILIHHIRHAWPYEYDLAWESTADGAEALAKVGRTSFAMIVLDWQLPTLHGADLLRRLRASGVDIPVIVVTGLDRAEIPDDLEAWGAAFLHKEGITPATLRDALAISARWLRKRNGGSPPNNELGL